LLVSFLICGLEGRPWQSLACSIQQQIDCLGIACEVLTNVDSGEKTSGMKRNELMALAKGRYVAFIDDDDKVASNYVESICTAIATEAPDVVTFCMSVTVTKIARKYSRGRHLTFKKKVHENWQLGLWPDDRKKSRMAANHLCCWKKEIAIKSAWCEHLGYGDDQLWYGPLHALRAAKTSVVIQDPLYFYDCDFSKSANQTSRKIAEARLYFGPGLRCFGDINSLLIEDGHQESVFIQCRDCSNHIVSVDTSKTQPFHTVVLL
jgi:hypothetical protein